MKDVVGDTVPPPPLVADLEVLHYDIDTRQEEGSWALLIEKEVSRATIDDMLESHGYKKDGPPGPFVDTAQWFSKKGKPLSLVNPSSFCRVVSNDGHVVFIGVGDIPKLEERF